ncbi:hypothetical protein AAY473_025395 [Plecturocebus cupreus]
MQHHLSLLIAIALMRKGNQAIRTFLSSSSPGGTVVKSTVTVACRSVCKWPKAEVSPPPSRVLCALESLQRPSGRREEARDPSVLYMRLSSKLLPAAEE